MIPKHNDFPRVLISKIQGFDNFYFTTSFLEKGQPVVAFHLINEKQTHFVEWETRWGPITEMKVVKGGISMEDVDHYGPIISHYFFEQTYGRGSWTQVAVDDLQLQEYASKGEYEYVYNALKRYLPE